MFKCEYLDDINTILYTLLYTTSLLILGNNWLTDASVKALTRNNHELRFLYFVDVPRVTDMSLKALGQCRNLLVLNVADCIR